jgi:LacI family transcriptional regulator
MWRRCSPPCRFPAACWNGASPKAEILRVRLDRVCRLLTESDLSLAEVAAKAGFDHPEYMSRLFKKKLGMTPGEFRRRSGPAGFTSH